MAYMSQEKKKEIEPKVKAILKKYGIKGRLGVRHHSTLVLRIASGKVDFIANYNDTNQHKDRFRPEKGAMGINTYWVHEHYTGAVKECLQELIAAMNNGNWDKSDIQSDYHNVGWYVDIRIGEYDKHYILEK